MSGTTMVILSAFVAYLLLMIVIGVVYMKKTSSSEDYFLGGRGLNAWVAALSAQASDMSGWLLMGVPGSNLFTGNRTDLDCCRSVHRNCIKLGVYFTQTS